MFPTFISIIDIQSWWEVPSIAHFCSLFRTAFNLLDFDIEDLEEALLTDGTEETSWLQELIVRLLSGCLPNNEISTFNYQMFLRRLFRQKCQEHDRYNPFNTDIDFQLLPLRTKVDILHALCDFRLDADDVFDQLKNLEADSLRVEPLGYDSNASAYWYFYGTRLYREDGRKKDNKTSVWQVICFTEDDWYQLAKKFKKSTNKQEKQLYQTLSENFLPEIPRLFKEKENLARKRLLESLPRRTSTRRRKQEIDSEKEREKKQKAAQLESERKLRHLEYVERKKEREKRNLESARQEAYERLSKKREIYERQTKLRDLSEEDSNLSEPPVNRDDMAGFKSRKSKDRQRKTSTSSSTSKDTVSKSSKKNKKHQKELQKISESSINTTTVGRQTNNSLSAATGQILIQPPPNSNKKRLKTSQVFRQTDEDLQTGMHKILDYVKNHQDAWPFIDPVEEEYAPNYYSIIRKPMDLQRMEERLDSGSYKNFAKFRSDFQLIVDNCRLYNGVENEYTEMVDNLTKVFDRATEKYLDMVSSSDDEIAIEYSSAESKKNSDDASKLDERSNAGSRRKPMLAAQTGKKRERSVSEGSESSRRSHANTENLDASSNKTEKLSKKQKKSLKSKTSKADKKQKINTKAEKSEKESKKNKNESNKDKSENSYKDTSSNVKSTKTSKVKVRKSTKKKKTPVRNRSVSRSPVSSPPRSDVSSSPVSWPLSSPDERFNFNQQESTRKRSLQTFNDSEDSLKGKKSKLPKYANDIDDPMFSNEENTLDYPITSLSPKPKDKHNKLRETIEKLKAKSEIKLRDEFEFQLDLPKENTDKNKKEEMALEDRNNAKIKDLEIDGNSTLDGNISDSRNTKKVVPKSNATITKPSNFDALTIATEQTLKDINKWLDDTPKFSEFSSASNSPSYTGCEDLDLVSGKVDQNVAKKTDKPPESKKEGVGKEHKKRSARDSAKFFKKREIQRTIDRLQPGKSKGNLISNVQNTNKVDEIFHLGPLSKIKDTKNSLIVKTDTNAPKLSLGSVLDSFGKHNFVDDQKREEQKILAEIPKENSSPNFKETSKQEKSVEIASKEEKDDKKENESVVEENLAGGATPNLSAWFKAFGAPKLQVVQKKSDHKPDGKENERLEDTNNKMLKVPAPIASPNTDVPVTTQGQPIPRQRKISTGSSVSERSSFSQDMDSPRVGMDERGAYPAPYPSPLHRSPSGASPVMASPRPDISPKATAYPTINGQIRCGFYQDTVSNKSSPDKSCSPKENPLSPYPHYSEHVYTPNTENSYYSYANSPYYTHAPNYSSSNPTPPYNMEGSGSYYDNGKTLNEQYQTKNSHNYSANSPASNHSSPAHPQNSPNLVLSAHSPNIHSPHSQHSPSISQRSPNVHLQHSPSFHAQQSPHPQPSPGFHSQHSPHSPNVLPHDTPNSPVQQLSQNSPDLRAQHSPSVPPPTSPKVPPNAVDADLFQRKDQNDVVLQQSGLQSAVFPMKKRAYTDDLSQVNEQRYEMEAKMTQKLNPAPPEGTQNLQEKTYRSYPNLELGDPQNNRTSSSPASQQATQAPVEPASSIYSGAKFPDSYEMTYNREGSCSLNIPNTRGVCANQPNPIDVSKYTNMGYTGPEVSLTNAVNSLAASQKPPVPMQVASPVVTQPMPQPMEMSRFSTASVPQRYKPVEGNVSHQPTPQQSHSSFASNSRTTDLQNQNVTVPRPTYNSTAIDVEQPLGLGRNIPSFSHLVDRYNTDERLIAGLQSSSSFYTDKGLGTPQLFNKPMSTNTSSIPMFSQADMAAMQQCYNQSIQGSPSIYNRPIPDIQNSVPLQGDQKTNLQAQVQEKKKKRKSSKVVPTPMDGQQSSTQHQGFQSYAGLKGNSSIEPSAISLKTSSVVPGSAFNFGPTPTALGISSSLYSDKDTYPNFLEEFRSTPNYYMAATAHHRSNPDAAAEKQTRAAHQSSNPQTAPGYPFLGASPQARPTYPIGGHFMPNAAQAAQLMDTSSPLYQHYLQAGVLNQSLLGPPGAYPPGYHPALSIRQPYDSMTRPSWL